MKPGKVLCCRFLFDSLGLIMHKTWQNTIGGRGVHATNPGYKEVRVR